MRLACLKYRSGQVKHWGKLYDRMKLIQAQASLIDEHSKQIKAIMSSKADMERVRDAAGKEADFKQYSIRLQDYGVLRESARPSPESDGPTSGGLKLNNVDLSPSYVED